MSLTKSQMLIVAAQMASIEAHAPAEASNQFVITRRYDADILPTAPMLDKSRSKHGFQRSWRPGKKKRSALIVRNSGMEKPAGAGES